MVTMMGRCRNGRQWAGSGDYRCGSPTALPPPLTFQSKTTWALGLGKGDQDLKKKMMVASFQKIIFQVAVWGGNRLSLQQNLLRQQR